MSGMTAFLRKERGETLHTWRIWVLPAILLFIGVTSPVMTVLLPAIVKWAARSDPGTQIIVGRPTAAASYLQFLGNLQQLVLLALIIVAGGAIAAELRSGTAALVLTKPISRPAFVFGKVIQQATLLLLSVVLGTVLCVALTAALLGLGPAGHFLLAVLAWVCYALMFLALMLLLSAHLRSQMAAAGMGIGIYAGVSILGLIPPLRDYTPAGVNTMSTNLLMSTAPVRVWPMITALVLAAGFVYWTIVVFRRREI